MKFIRPPSHLSEDDEFQQLCRIILFEFTGTVKVESKTDEFKVRHDRILLAKPIEVIQK